ncbi:MAG: hypothetical protein NC230_06100 [Bacteroides sp.]|nr:hypothetical protein [Bacteroides sp.]
MRIITSFLLLASVLTISSCNSDKKSADQTDLDASAVGQTGRDADAEAQRDSLIALFNDISGDLIQIKEVESIVSLPSNLITESGKSTPQLRDDLSAIRQTLQTRRERLLELEKKLNASSGQNADLLKMIDNLKVQMEQSEATIASLTQQLADANTQIAGLNVKVDSLNTSVATVTAEKNVAQQQNVDLTNELNQCFYAIGSKSELQKHKIIETGFLRKTKIMQGDYEASYFTKADRRNLTQLPLYSKKAKVMTNQPTDSYVIESDASGMKTLKITNPNRFWGTGNYLVVQID